MSYKIIDDISYKNRMDKKHYQLITTDVSAPDLPNMIDQIDLLLSHMIDQVLHHSKFKVLEATWHGVARMARASHRYDDVIIALYHTSKNELLSIARNAPTLDSDPLLECVFDQEFNTPGGTPYGTLICDFTFNHSQEDVTLLRYLANIGETAHCPVITAADPSLFAIDHWHDINKFRSLSDIVQSDAHISWNQLRQEESSKYIFLTIPRFLSRHLYKEASTQFTFTHNETIRCNEDYPWCNSAYLQAECIINSFIQHGWCTSIRGRENGGTISKLPLTNALKATEHQFSDTQEKCLSDLGLIPVCHYKHTDFAVIFACNSLHQPQEYDTCEASQNAKISSRLPYILAVSRFAHYLKIIARDKIGSFSDKESIEIWLNKWISQYVNANAKAREQLKAKFPLAEARISVADTPDHPGVYQATIHLRPWLQLEALSASLRLVTQLPKGQP